jgi:hypothetical protein
VAAAVGLNEKPEKAGEQGMVVAEAVLVAAAAVELAV